MNLEEKNIGEGGDLKGLAGNSDLNVQTVDEYRSSFLNELDLKLRSDSFFAMPESMHKVMMSVLTRVLNEKDESGHVVKKRILGKVLDASFFAYIKLPLEAYVGRRITGDMPLEEVERVCYLISGVTGLLAWALGAEGARSWDSNSLELAGAFYGTSWLSYLIGIQREIEDTLVRIHSQVENKQLVQFMELMNELIHEEITYARK